MLANPKTHNPDAPAGSIEQLDPLGAPIPGQSLTDSPNEGKWEWEKPPKFTDVDEALGSIVERIEKNVESGERVDRLLLSGTPVETLVNTIAFAGFSEGQWSPDIAELMKPPLSAYFILRGMEKDIPLRIFNNKPKRKMMNNDAVMRGMKDNNPEAFSALEKEISMATLPMEEKSFMDMEEQPMDMEEQPMDMEEQPMDMGEQDMGGMI
jgi:hypothetical protein|tara:strand:- start:178 stop:804 length:627 start_codon:yes stop_codon:yes gene_type:complete